MVSHNTQTNVKQSVSLLCNLCQVMSNWRQEGGCPSCVRTCHPLASCCWNLIKVFKEGRLRQLYLFNVSVTPVLLGREITLILNGQIGQIFGISNGSAR